MENFLFLDETESTNHTLQQLIRKDALEEGFVLHTDFQSAGKGQSGNTWESEAGKNLLFSLLLKPQNILAEEQFLISQVVSISIKQVLDQYIDDVKIKWPNDIYWKDKKIAGILIENSLMGRNINTSIVGIGLNVNQIEYKSTAPNPVSMTQITHKNYDRLEILHKIVETILSTINNHERLSNIPSQYLKMLYRANGYFLFSDNSSLFEARIISVDLDGRIGLETKNAEIKYFYFKEVSFVIE